MLSGVSTGVNAPQMASLKKGLSESREPVHQSMNQVIPPGKLRKASPEAIALLMANKEKHEKMNNSGYWVPGGGAKQ